MAEDKNQPQRIPRDADEGYDTDNDASNTNKRSRELFMDSSKRSKRVHDDDEEEGGENQATTEDTQQDVNGREGTRGDNDDDNETNEEESESSESEEESSEEEVSEDEAERSARAAGTSERRSIVVNLGPSTLPPARPPAPPPTPIEPTGNDVLFAPRHVEFRQCPGNQKLNFLVKSEGPRYHASDYATKTMMIQGVVALLRQLEPPGRFLKYEQHIKKWIECSDEYAHMQVLSMFARQLRDGSLDNSAGSQNDNDEDGGGDDAGAEEQEGSNHQSEGENAGSSHQRGQPQDDNEGDDRKPRARDPQTDHMEGSQYHLDTFQDGRPTLIEPVGRRTSGRFVDGLMEEKDDNDGFCYTSYRDRGLAMVNLSAAVWSLNDRSEVATEDTDTVFGQYDRNKLEPSERSKSALIRGALQAQAARANLRAAAKSIEFEERDAVQLSTRDDAFRGNLRPAMEYVEDDGMVALERAWLRGMMLEPRSTTPLASKPPLIMQVQSEPQNLVGPSYQPRRPGRKDRDPILPGVFSYSAPKCGSRPFEVAKAAAAAIMGHSTFSAADEKTKISGVTEDASKFVTKITTNDVLTGRSHSRVDHVGNLRCREAVRLSVDQYVMAASITDKNEVIDEIRCYVQEKGGRFLKHKIGWKELTVESARSYIVELMRAAILEREQKQEKLKTESTRRAHCGSSQSEVMPEFDYRSERTEQSIRDEGQSSFDRTAVASSLDTEAVGLDLDDACEEEKEEVARVNETGFEDAVVELALYNYECFYGLKPGSAFFDLVQSTSAGIEGWASAVLSEERQRGCMDKPSREKPHKVAPANQRKGDQEEDRMLRDALLESVGAKPHSHQSVQTKEEWDDEFDNNCCDDDNSSCSSEGDWSQEAYENGDLHFDEERTARNLSKASTNEVKKRKDSESEAISVERLKDSKKEDKSSSCAGTVPFEEKPYNVAHLRGWEIINGAKCGQNTRSPADTAEDESNGPGKGATIKIQEERTSSSDDESWSEVSKSDGDLSDGVLVNQDNDSDITDGGHP